MSKPDFIKETTLILYSPELFEHRPLSDFSEINFNLNDGAGVEWLNTYGFSFQQEFRTIVKSQRLDDFLIKLLRSTEHNNKVIELDGILFLAIRVLKVENETLDSEQMVFMASERFVWSIQEKPGDHFGGIRNNLKTNVGIARSKKADYLLFLLLEAIIGNYERTFGKYMDAEESLFELSSIQPTPAFTSEIEGMKIDLYKLKKAAMALRNTVTKLLNVEQDSFETKYFSELKEQASNLIYDIDSAIQGLESIVNLIFSIQGHRLNEVMKTLTILSAVFIPITFIAGVYGMNFDNMPELHTRYGYFFALGAMLLIVLLCLLYFYKKKWFQ